MNGVLLHFLNAVLSEKITFLWKCLKLLTSIQQKFTCISLREKQSVPTLQFTVRCEWSVASLSKCSPFRENHSLLKLPLATYKHSQETHICFSEREAVCSNISIHSAKWMECCFTFKMLSFQRKSLFFESALSYLQAFTINSHPFLWKKSSLFQTFNSLCVVNGVLLHFLYALLLEKITLFWNCLKILTSIHKKLTSFSLK